MGVGIEATEGTDGNLWWQYRRELLEERAVPAIRTFASLVLVTNLTFVGVDWYAYPEQFWVFFPARMALNAVLLVVTFWACRRYPSISQIVLGAVTGALLLFVIYGAGPLGGYYVGLLLLFSGLPMILPLSTMENLALCSALVVGYGVFPWSIEQAIDWDRYVVQNGFLISSAIISVANCHQLNRSRFRDFVQRKELEAARDNLKELDQAKSRFTANVHHELRTPLTLMLAPLEAMRAGSYGVIPESAEQALRTMHVNGRRLQKLINNLLDLARLESEQFRLDKRNVDVCELASDVLDGARPLADRKGLSLVLECESDAAVVRADRDALDKVLVNLVGNALKFTDNGRITIAVEERADGVEVSVSDTGTGIPEDQLDQVFNRFAQVDASSTRLHEGTGIGLSLVKELVELHEGRVWAESSGAGCGTTMRVQIPRGDVGGGASESQRESLSDGELYAVERSEVTATADLEEQRLDPDMEQTVARWEAAEATSPEIALRQSANASAAEILVADDNPDMRQLLGFLLGEEYRVRLARNGREALAAVNERCPDLVLADVMMPEMSGIELCGALKREESTRGVPVVLVTSRAEQEMKIEGLELGADDYVTKPFHPRELVARVRSLVRLRMLQDEIADQNATLERSNRELASALEELKEAEVQLVRSERLAAIGELSAGVAHEVNNPLNFARNSLSTLRSYAEDVAKVVRRVSELDVSRPEKLEAQIAELEGVLAELRFEEISGDLVELVSIVGEGLDRTARLVGDLRDFAAPPHRGGLAHVDIGAGLRSTIELAGHRMREGGVVVEEALEGDVPWVQGRAGALNQVFLNLLKNAAEAIEEKGGGRIVVSARREGAEAVVRVQDDGPGMSAEVRERLFEPFFTTKSAGRGTGLGLSICRRIVEEHGGRIEVESGPGEGTTMVVRLPAGEADAA